MRCPNCNRLRGGAIPEQLSHYQRLMNTRITQMRKAEAARNVLEQQFADLIAKFERLGVAPRDDHKRIVNLTTRYKSADAKVREAHQAVDEASAKVMELMDQLVAYYAANPVANENEFAANLGLDPNREPLVPYDDNANRGAPGPEREEREGLGRTRKSRFDRTL